MWPETELGWHASSECSCAEFLDSLAGRVLRFCGGDYSNGAQWSDHVDTSMCAALMSDVTNLLCEVAAAVSLLKHPLQKNCKKNCLSCRVLKIQL